MNRAKYSQSSFTAEPKSAGGDSVCGAPAGRAGNYPALHPGAFPAHEVREEGDRLSEVRNTGSLKFNRKITQCFPSSTPDWHRSRALSYCQRITANRAARHRRCLGISP